MAKKKAARKKVGRPKTEQPREQAFVIKSRPEWREWLTEFANHCGYISVAQLVSEALRSFAEKMGFRKPPQR